MRKVKGQWIPRAYVAVTIILVIAAFVSPNLSGVTLAKFLGIPHSVEILVRLSPAVLAGALAFMSYRVLHVADQKAGVLDLSQLGVTLASSGLADKEKAVVTYRFTCPHCAGNITYARGHLPIVCDSVHDHVWPYERALYDDLLRVGNTDQANHLAKIVYDASN